MYHDRVDVSEGSNINNKSNISNISKELPLLVF